MKRIIKITIWIVLFSQLSVMARPSYIFELREDRNIYVGIEYREFMIKLSILPSIIALSWAEVECSTALTIEGNGGYFLSISKIDRSESFNTGFEVLFGYPQIETKVDTIEITRNVIESGVGYFLGKRFGSSIDVFAGTYLNISYDPKYYDSLKTDGIQIKNRISMQPYISFGISYNI